MLEEVGIDYELDGAVSGSDFLLGESFSMADIIFGGTLRFMMQFGMVEKRPSFTAYVERLTARPALQRADARNAAETAEHELNG